MLNLRCHYNVVPIYQSNFVRSANPNLYRAHQNARHFGANRAVRRSVHVTINEITSELSRLDLVGPPGLGPLPWTIEDMYIANYDNQGQTLIRIIF